MYRHLLLLNPGAPVPARTPVVPVTMCTSRPVPRLEAFRVARRVVWAVGRSIILLSVPAILVHRMPALSSSLPWTSPLQARFTVQFRCLARLRIMGLIRRALTMLEQSQHTLHRVTLIRTVSLFSPPLVGTIVLRSRLVLGTAPNPCYLMAPLRPVGRPRIPFSRRQTKPVPVHLSSVAPQQAPTLVSRL